MIMRKHVIILFGSKRADTKRLRYVWAMSATNTRYAWPPMFGMSINVHARMNVKSIKGITGNCVNQSIDTNVFNQRSHLVSLMLPLSALSRLEALLDYTYMERQAKGHHKYVTTNGYKRKLL